MKPATDVYIDHGIALRREFDGDCCDFCNRPNPRYRLLCSDFVFTTSPMLRNIGDWMACDTCNEMIDQDRWEDLAQRAATSAQEFFRVHVPDAPGDFHDQLEHARATQAEFRRHYIRQSEPIWNPTKSYEN